MTKSSLKAGTFRERTLFMLSRKSHYRQEEGYTINWSPVHHKATNRTKTQANTLLPKEHLKKPIKKILTVMLQM